MRGAMALFLIARSLWGTKKQLTPFIAFRKYFGECLKRYRPDRRKSNSI